MNVRKNLNPAVDICGKLSDTLNVKSIDTTDSEVVICDFELYVPATEEMPESYLLIDPDRCFYFTGSQQDIPVNLTSGDIDDLQEGI